jgi:AbrB family looped-hinge helix DNA binding protein
MGTVISLTRKGQLTIPKAVREALGLKPFDRVEVEVVGQEARLRKVPLTLDDLVGILPPLDPPMDPDDMIRIAKEERIQRWREKFG